MRIFAHYSCSRAGSFAPSSPPYAFPLTLHNISCATYSFHMHSSIYLLHPNRLKFFAADVRGMNRRTVVDILA